MRALFYLAVFATYFAFCSAAQAQEASPQVRQCIFFDTNSAVVPFDGQTVVQEAVQKAMAADANVVVVTGHGNLVESHMDAQLNNAGPENAQLLSVSRAQAVASALTASGLPASVTIKVAGVGVSQPLVPEALSEDARAALAGSNNNFDRGSLSGEPMNKAACIAY